ncbi:unnamed protein product [Diabrotica balteata]|uniref:Reverse transcriptase RNase H-like domain-containing protein n=1 Tax=Diabrotica balteata TaxID=107213 RepID=A0A9P0DXT8_DIABA|nr:unnamed protein product [Diabrotica balteata]
MGSRKLQLHRPDATRPFSLQTDDSDIGMGAVLFPGTQEKKEVIAYSSTKLKPAEKRYHINEKECLALVWALKKYKHFLHDQHFTLYTDSQALLWRNRFKEDKAKLSRWAILLQEFNFSIKHIPGK